MTGLRYGFELATLDPQAKAWRNHQDGPGLKLSGAQVC